MKAFLKQNEAAGVANNGVSKRAVQQEASAGVVAQLEREKKDLLEQRDDLEEQLQELSSHYNRIEQSLVESKLLSATLDMENDKLTVDLKRRNELIKKYAERVTKLETELVQARVLSEPSEAEDSAHKKKPAGFGFGSFFKKQKPKH